MSSDDEKIMLTLEEINVIKQVAVQEAKLEILVGDFQSTRKHTDENIAKIFELLRAFPKQVTDCRDTLEKDFDKKLDTHYATDTDVRELRTELTNKIDNISRRFKWTTGLIVAIIGAIQFITTMWFMSLQITKLAGGA